LLPRVFVKDRLGVLENIEPVFESGLVQLPDGRLIWDHNKEGTDLKSDEKDMCRLVEDLPAKTVRKANAIKHYCKHRCLTIRERARLQSLPDEHKLAGRSSEKSDQIGNAVPENLARAVARSIMASLKDE
jgi:DNA (cytosine-5)-methyltransferase 1